VRIREEIIRIAEREGINYDDRYLRLIMEIFTWYEQERMSRLENLATKNDLRETKQEIKDDIKMLIHMIDKRFEDMQHYMDKRFEEMHNSMKRLQWFMGIALTILAILISFISYILHK